ncbi:hypothetical protein B0H13DRAFT_1900182 [Mycena leptocephala]|nr:hypothetical protein B0H13DRAFT_1900182 [Mycena leptocephala]
MRRAQMAFTRSIRVSGQIEVQGKDLLLCIGLPSTGIGSPASQSTLLLPFMVVDVGPQELLSVLTASRGERHERRGVCTATRADKYSVVNSITDKTYQTANEGLKKQNTINQPYRSGEVKKHKKTPADGFYSLHSKTAIKVAEVLEHVEDVLASGWSRIHQMRRAAAMRGILGGGELNETSRTMPIGAAGLGGLTLGKGTNKNLINYLSACYAEQGGWIPGVQSDFTSEVEA